MAYCLDLQNDTTCGIIDFMENKIGDIKRDKRSNKLVWVACPDCRKERWVQQTRKTTDSARCSSCAAKLAISNGTRRILRGSELYNWKGGRHRDKQGYAYVRLAPSDFYFPMIKPNGYVREHRLVMAMHLGRCLHLWEVVHHKNGVKDDNRLENLELTTNGQHHLAHSKGYKDGYQRGLSDGRNKQIQELKTTIAELRGECGLP